MIAFDGLLLLPGRLGDLVGRKRMFVLGLATFTTASLLCGMSVNQEMLVVARFLQGAGGVMASAVVMGMIVTMFREALAFTMAAGVVVAAIVVGLIVLRPSAEEHRPRRTGDVPMPTR